MPRPTHRDRRLQHARLKPNKQRSAAQSSNTSACTDTAARPLAQTTHAAVSGLTCCHREAKTGRLSTLGMGLGRRGRRQPAGRGLLTPGSWARQGSVDVYFPPSPSG